MQKQYIETIGESVDQLLKSPVGLATSKSSLNLEFLERQLSSEHNIQLILCGSSLFEWARSHASDQIPRCGHRNPDESTPDDSENLNHVFVGHDEISITGTITSAPNPNTSALVAATGQGRLLSSRQQICAKLHCLYGVPIDYITKDFISNSRYNLRYKSLLIHPYVRSRVYDLRQHTDTSLWGPFTDDGPLDVDWEKLESVMLILNHNMRRYSSRYSEPGDDVPAWDQPFAGVSPYSYISKPFNLPEEPLAPLETQDPYGISGTWMRVVCFLDYTELYDFNFSEHRPPPEEPRPPLDTEEVTRLITMKIKVTKISSPEDEDGQDLPVVHFKGLSSSLRPSWDPNANSRIRGQSRGLR